MQNLCKLTTRLLRNMSWPNYIHGVLLAVITHPYPDFKGGLTEPTLKGISFNCFTMMWLFNHIMKYNLTKAQQITTKPCLYSWDILNICRGMWIFVLSIWKWNIRTASIIKWRKNMCFCFMSYLIRLCGSNSFGDSAQQCLSIVFEIWSTIFEWRHLVNHCDSDSHIVNQTS